MRLLLLTLAAFATAASAQTGGQFVDISTGPDGPPLTGEITTLAVGLNGVVYAGGAFIPSFGDPVAGVGRWDGSGWESLGGGVNGIVSDLAVAPNGHLYVSGTFTEVGGQPFPEVARWTGQQWRRVRGTHPEGPPRALAVAPDRTLYGTGGTSSPDAPVYRHTGTSWEPVGTDAFAADDIAVGPDGTLYAAGRFTDVGPNGARYLARWDGANWQPVGSGVNGPVESLSVSPDGTVAVGGNLITEAGDTPTNRIATWNGTAWTPYLNDELVNLQVVAFAPDGVLHIGGSFGPLPAGPFFRYVARWNGFSTELLPERADLPTNLLAFSPDGDLYLGGSFPRSSSRNVSSVTRWGDESWEPLGSAFDTRVTALAVREDGAVCASGPFRQAGGGAARNVACRVDGKWEPVGEGIDDLVGFRLVSGGGSTLYASALNSEDLLEWTGTQWDTLSSGAAIRAMHVGPDNSLYLAGWFTDSDLPTMGIVRRTGNSWETLGTDTGLVDALVIAGDGLLYAGGEFEQVNGAPADFVMRWTGTVWESLPAPISGPVLAFATGPSGTLYAAHQSDVLTANRHTVSRWTGSQWESLGDVFLNSDINALVTDSDGVLYAGGRFEYPHSTPAPRNIARWTGGEWEALSEELFGTVFALAATPEGDLVIGGDFLYVGETRSPFIALYDAPFAVSIDPEASTGNLTLGLGPNPASGSVTARLGVPMGTVARVEVLDLLGRRLAVAFEGVITGEREIAVQVDSFAPGIYLVRLATEAGTRTERLTVAR
ncbi:MAG: T9SS type A sorting domain-containing protein [Bacteroidota bacterium]